MAKSSSRTGKIEPIRTPNAEENGAATAVAEPETPFDPPQPPAATEPPRPRGRPPLAVPKLQTFMQRIAGIAPEDWGTRAKIRLYRLAPIIDRNRGSDTKYITMYEEPIDEDRIKKDWGSGRYRLYLGFKTAGGAQEKELDMVEFDIMDMKYPPVVPPGEWVDDHRNKQWSWAKASFPKENGATPAAPAAPPPVDPIAAFDTFLNIQDRIESRTKPAEQPTAPTPPAPIDPFATAAKILEMRSSDPVITMLMQQIEGMRKSEENARQREYDLQKELRQMQTQTVATAQPKGLLEQLKELGSLKDTLKEVLGVGDAATTVARAGRTNWMDLAREIVPQVINSELMAGIGAKIAASATAGAAPNPAMSPQQTPANSQADTGEAAFQSWIRNTVNKQVIRFFLTMRMDGDDLADVLYATEPEWTLRLQAFEHPQLPGLKGKEAILAAYRVTPSVWPQIQQQGRAAEFETFVEQFCNWKPDDAEPDEDDGVIDLTATPSGSSEDEGEGEA